MSYLMFFYQLIKSQFRFTCFDSKQKLKEPLFTGERIMIIKLYDIKNNTTYNRIITTVKSRKHKTISADEYDVIESIVVNHYFESHPEIDRKKWSSWSIANSIKELLHSQLKEMGFIRLPKDSEEKIHSHETKKKGLAKLAALERRIKLEKKLRVLKSEKQAKKC